MEITNILSQIYTFLQKSIVGTQFKVRYVDTVIKKDETILPQANTVSFKNQGNITVYVNSLKLEPSSGMVTFGNELPHIDDTDYTIYFDYTDTESEQDTTQQKPNLLLVKRVVIGDYSFFNKERK